MSVDPDYTSWQRKQRQPVLSHLTALTSLSCTGEGLFAVQADEVRCFSCCSKEECIRLRLRRILLAWAVPAWPFATSHAATMLA